jgi:hypothetical protein
MASLTSINEINERLTDDKKPLKLIGNFRGVHNEAQFECDNGHKFYDLPHNILRRTSVKVIKYCPRCKDVSKNITRKLMATKFITPNVYVAWGKKRTTYITYHKSGSKEELEQWCLTNEGSLPTWTRDDDQWDSWKIPMVITRSLHDIGTRYEWIAGRRTDKGKFEPSFYADKHDEVVNWATLCVFKDKEEFYTPVYMEMNTNNIVSLNELTRSKQP